MSASCGAPAQTLDPAGIAAGQTVLQGTVSRAGTPIGGAYVRLLDGTGEFTAEVVTSAEGEFRFYAAPGSWTVRVLAPGASAERAALAVAGEITRADVVLIS